MKTCKNCGKQLSDDAKFCDGCGTAIEEISTPTVEVQPSQPAQEEIEVIDVDAVVSNSSPSTADQTVSQPTIPVEPTPVAPVETTPVTPVDNTSTVMNQTAVSQPAAPAVPQKKSNTALVVIISVLVTIIVVLLVVIGIKFFGGKNEFTSSESGNTSNNNDPVTTTTEDPKDTATADTIELSGYEFTIPTGFTSKIVENYIVFTNVTDKIQFNIAVQSNFSYSTLLAHIDELKNEFTSMGITVLSANQEKVDGKDVLVLSLSDSSGNQNTAIFTSIGTIDTACSYYINYGTKLDSEVKSTIVNTISKAKAKTSSFAGETETETKDYVPGQFNVPSFTITE